MKNIDIDREEYDLSYKIKINTETVNECISEIENNCINNKEEFYLNCVLERFDKCNKVYLRDFDSALDKLYDDMFSEDKDFDFYEFKRLLKSSTKLTSNIYNNYIDLIYSLNK